MADGVEVEEMEPEADLVEDSLGFFLLEFSQVEDIFLEILALTELHDNVDSIEAHVDFTESNQVGMVQLSDDFDFVLEVLDHRNSSEHFDGEFLVWEVLHVPYGDRAVTSSSQKLLRQVVGLLDLKGAVGEVHIPEEVVFTLFLRDVFGVQYLPFNGVEALVRVQPVELLFGFDSFLLLTETNSHYIYTLKFKVSSIPSVTHLLSSQLAALSRAVLDSSLSRADLGSMFRGCGERKALRSIVIGFFLLLFKFYLNSTSDSLFQFSY